MLQTFKGQRENRSKTLLIIGFQNYESAPSEGAIWNEFNEQHQHQSMNKYHISCPINTFLVQIRCRFKF